MDEFTKSVLANPENQDMARQQERQKFIANPLTAIDQEVRKSSERKPNLISIFFAVLRSC